MKNILAKKQTIFVIVIVIVGLLLGGLILGTGKSRPDDAASGQESHKEEKGHADTEHHGEKPADKHDDANAHADREHHEDSPAKGPHGGRMFAKGDFGLEVLLSEDGGEPRFRIYPYTKNKPLPPDAAKVSATLTRPGGETQEIAFSPEKDYLNSSSPIAEPHVFDATITAQSGKESYTFTFIGEEGKIALTDAQVKAAGVTIQTAGPARVKTALTVPGEIRFNEDRTAHVVPRLSGVVESVQANLGQQVRKGQVLAVIASTDLSEQRSQLQAAQKRQALARLTFEREKKLWQEKISAEQDYLQAQQVLREAEIAVQNASQKLRALGATAGGSGALSRYEIRAPFDGMVVEKHISLGESVKEDAKIFTVSDLSSVWAEVAVAPKNLNAVRVGGKATVSASAFDSKAGGTISYVGALLGEETRTAKARITLANPHLAWRPGLSVDVDIVADEKEVAVAVAADALHTIGDKPAIFVKTGGGFVAQPILIGRTDGTSIEVVQGLKAGTPYAAKGSFVIKSELGKASAAHAH